MSHVTYATGSVFAWLHAQYKATIHGMYSMLDEVCMTESDYGSVHKHGCQYHSEEPEQTRLCMEA